MVHPQAPFAPYPHRRSTLYTNSTPLLRLRTDYGQTELGSHYFEAMLPQQFDEYLWIDETRGLHPLEGAPMARREGEMPDTYPFGV